MILLSDHVDLGKMHTRSAKAAEANDTIPRIDLTSEATDETTEISKSPKVAIKFQKTISNTDTIDGMIMGRSSRTVYTCSLCPDAPPLEEVIKCNPQLLNRRFSTHIY